MKDMKRKGAGLSLMLSAATLSMIGESFAFGQDSMDLSASFSPTQLQQMFVQKDKHVQGIEDPMVASMLMMDQTSDYAFRPKYEAQVVAGFDLPKLQTMADYANLAYVKDVTGENQTHLESIEKLKAQGYKVMDFGIENPGIVVVEPNGNVVISYRGTKTLGNLKTDADAGYATSSEMKGSFHRGFLRGFESTKEHLLDQLNEIARRQGKKLNELNITVTGHSLGGSFATIMGKYLDEVQGVNNLKVAAFAPGRAMDYAGAQDYNQRSVGKNTIIVRETVDPIAMFGPWLGGGHHVGAELHLPKLKQDMTHKMGGYINALNGLAAVHDMNKSSIMASGARYAFEPTPARPGIVSDISTGIQNAASAVGNGFKNIWGYFGG